MADPSPPMCAKQVGICTRQEIAGFQEFKNDRTLDCDGFSSIFSFIFSWILKLLSYSLWSKCVVVFCSAA